MLLEAREWERNIGAASLQQRRSAFMVRRFVACGNHWYVSFLLSFLPVYFTGLFLSFFLSYRYISFFIIFFLANGGGHMLYVSLSLLSCVSWWGLVCHRVVLFSWFVSCVLLVMVCLVCHGLSLLSWFVFVCHGLYLYLCLSSCFWSIASILFFVEHVL